MAVSQLPLSSEKPANALASDEASDGISVEPLPDLETLMGGILSAYRLKEFDAGYGRAVTDVVNALALESALYLRSRTDASPDARRLVSAFASHLERRITAFRPSSHTFFEDGLGI